MLARMDASLPMLRTDHSIFVTYCCTMTTLENKGVNIFCEFSNRGSASDTWSVYCQQVVSLPHVVRWLGPHRTRDRLPQYVNGPDNKGLLFHTEQT